MGHSESHSRLRELVDFVLRPSLEVRFDESANSRLKDTFCFYLLGFFLSLLAALFASMLNVDNEMLDDLRSNQSSVYIFFIAVIFAPLSEECMFRLWLKFSSLKFTFSLLLILGAVGFKLSKSGFPDFQGADYAIPLVVMVVLLLVYFTLERMKASIEKFWIKNFRWLYYSSVLLFGAVHISNFSFAEIDLWVWPILILPQLISGFFYGYVRVKHGFVYGVLMHFLHNLSLIFLVI